MTALAQGTMLSQLIEVLTNTHTLSLQEPIDRIGKALIN
jgi:hypothetical protein